MGDMQQKPFDYIWLTPDTRDVIEEYLSRKENAEYKIICDKTSAFLSGFYSNYLLELLSTVDFILSTKEELHNWLTMDIYDITSSVEESIAEWSKRKKLLFCDRQHIDMVVEHLKEGYTTNK